MDVGTGGTRAVLVDEKGQLAGSASSEHEPFRTPHPGWAEQDPEDWWRAAQQAIREVLASGARVDAVGLTGQMHGAVMLDKDGKVLRPALIWCDVRTGPQCDWLHKVIGRERLIELTANPALPNFTLTKLLWVKEHEPEIFARIAHILCPKDYVRYRLTGTYAMDVQEASGTLLLDVAHRRWSKEVAKIAGIPESWLPELFESPEICAKISDEAAQTDRPEGRNAGGRWCRRSGRWRGWHGHSAAGFGFGHDWDFGRGFCCDGRADARSAGPPAYLLPRGAWTLACDGRDPGCWLVAALAARDAGSRPDLRRPYRSGQDSCRQRRPALDAVSARRTHAASRSNRDGSVCRHHRDDHARPLHPRRARRRGLFAEGHLHALLGAGHSGERRASRWRRRARPAVARDSGEYLWLRLRAADRRRRRSVWRGADGRRWRRTLGESR
jgi:hypothetical protein